MPTLPDGRNVSDDQYKAYWTEVFRNDPEMQRIFASVQDPGRRSQAQAALAQLQPMVAALEQRRMANPGAPLTPQEQQLLSQYQQARFVAQAGDSGEKGREFEAEQRAQQLGWTPEKDWSVDFDNGGFRVERENFVNRNQDWLIPGAIGAVGAAGALGAFGGAAGSAATGGGAAGSSAVPAAGATVGPGVGFGAGGVPVGTTLGGTTMATAVGGSAIPSALGTAASVAGGGLPFWAKAAMGFGSDALKTFFGNRASNKANDALQAGGDKAIETFQQALGPYMNLGGQAAGNLGFLMGMGPLPGAGGPSAPVNAGSTPVSTPVQTGRTIPEGGMVTGQAIPRPQAPPNMVDPRGFGSLAGRVDPARAMSQSSFVRMRAPDGEIGDVPAARMQEALADGLRPFQG